LAGKHRRHAFAQLDDLAHELVADHERRLDGVLGPLVPAVDVQVGAADPCAENAKQHLTRPWLGLRHVLEPEARLPLRLDQGLHLPPVGPDLILLAFVPGLVFEASLALDLEEMRRRVVPISLLATVGVFLTVLLIGAMAHYGLGLDWASGFLLGAIVAATDPIAVVQLLRQIGAPRGLEAILDGESLFNDGTGVAVFAAVLGTILSGH